MSEDHFTKVIAQAAEVEEKLRDFLMTLGEDKELLTMAVGLALISHGGLTLAPLYKGNRDHYMGIIREISSDIFDRLAEETDEQPS